MSNKRKPSKAQIRVLTSLADGRPVYDHCKTNSDWGGLQSTLASLRRRGLMGNNGEITRAGLEALGRQS